MSTHNVPVLVGVGEVVEKQRQLELAREPLSLMHAALLAAEQDAGVALLAQLDSLEIVAEHSWPYADAPALLAGQLGIQPRHAVYGETGGESPIRFLHEAALRIARGESRVAAVMGAEATYSVAAAKKAGISLPWTPRDRSARLLRGRDIVNPISMQYGIENPTEVYPFYENATLAAWGQTPAQALQETGEIWSRFSQVASGNPAAWSRKTLLPEDIITTSDNNRLIAWPYTKHVVANPLVNQGAAVLMTSEAQAQALGISREKLVYVWGGAAAKEPRDYLLRDQYQRSHAQDAVLEQAKHLAGPRGFDHVELYSCFPCVPKMARRVLNLAADRELSVTGGLNLFGAPLNNYMTHAACAMVRRLRAGSGASGLLYGQGEYVTKHHALVLGTEAGAAEALRREYQLDAGVTRSSAAMPELKVDHRGDAQLETFTILYTREGMPAQGVVICRSPQGARLMARVPASDSATLAVLTDLRRSPVNRPGRAQPGEDGLLNWQAI